MRKMKKKGIVFKADNGIVVIQFKRISSRDKYRKVYRLNKMMSGIYLKIQ